MIGDKIEDKYGKQDNESDLAKAIKKENEPT
jgi:hypothetical protein